MFKGFVIKLAISPVVAPVARDRKALYDAQSGAEGPFTATSWVFLSASKAVMNFSLG